MYRTSSRSHYNRRIWWLFKLKVIFLSGPILYVAVLKSNHEEADRKFSSFVLHVIIFNYITGISTHSKSGASAPWGDRMQAEAEDLLVPVFRILDPIPEACLQRILNWFATTELCCKYSELHVLCTRLRGCSKADASNWCVKRHSFMLKSMLKNLRKFRKFIYNIYNTNQQIIFDRLKP